jgi:molecular chaperone DnaK
MGKIIGIDLGTTNSCVAVIDGGEAVVVPNSEGSRTTPSMVGFTEAEERFVGLQAKRQAIINAESTIHGVKRLMGRKYRNEVVQRQTAKLSFQVVENINGDAWVSVRGKNYSPQEISAQILRKMKSTAEDYFGEEVVEAVITAPAYFDDAQRQATKDAGKIAGLNVRRVLNEPTAAALAYGFHNRSDGIVAVFDLGGGTFDISLLQLHEGVFEVMATSGNASLGGDDFDMVILGHLIEKFNEETGIDVSEDKMALQRLREAAENAKCELSSMTETSINLPFLAVDDSGPRHFSMPFDRELLNGLVQDLVDQLSGPCKTVISDAGMKPGDIDDVILVGGMTRMPLVQEKVLELFGKEPQKGVNPDEVVAIGAAIQAGVLDGEIKEVVLLDVTPMSLGIRVADDGFSTLIPKNTSIPARVAKTFTTTKDNQELVTVAVHQGESKRASRNRLLGLFNLTGVAASKAGIPRIEVTFDIDTDGIVNVTAIDANSGTKQSIVVTGHSGLSDEELQRAMQRNQP